MQIKNPIVVQAIMEEKYSIGVPLDLSIDKVPPSPKIYINDKFLCQKLQKGEHKTTEEQRRKKFYKNLSVDLLIMLVGDFAVIA